MIGVMSWFCLRLHAGYRCRHVGACCRADWEIPAQAHVLEAVEVESLRASEGARRLLDELERGIDVRVPRRADGTCLFFEPGATGSCAIHREAGEDALPTACRHFPREVLVNGRGTFVSLSHYCPTAAALLTTPSALDTVEARAPLRLVGPIDGLDVRTWTPGDGSLAAAVDAAFRSQTGVRSGSDRGQTAARPRAHFLASAFAPLVAQHIPHEASPVADYERTWQPLAEGCPAVELVAKNYVAARLFANWIAYQGQGLRTVVEWLRTCHSVLRNEMALHSMASGRATSVDEAVAAAGRADLLLVHTIDSAAFASYFVEREKT